jgi:polysaccharide biosynthesis protein PelG
MPTINNSLEAMTRQGTLLSVLGAYLYAALLVAGPWIFTVLGLSCLGTAGCDGPCAGLPVFRSIVIYNSMYALIVTSPLAFFSGRYVSEQLHRGREQGIFLALIASLGIYCTLCLAVVAPFYVFATTLGPAEQIVSVQNAVMLGCSWLLIPVLGALRRHNAVLVAFGLGGLCMLVLGRLLHDASATSLLLAFDGSFAVTNLVMLAVVVRRFGTELTVDAGFGRRLRRAWELPAAGAGYAAGLWVDKIIMWLAAPTGGLLVAGGIRTMPSYDAAMFWSQLCSIPVIAVFFVHVETGFAAAVQKLQLRLQQRASLRELNEVMRGIRMHVLASLTVLFVALVIVAGMMVLLSFVYMSALGLRPADISILRVSLCAMAFYTSAMFCANFLFFLDLRRDALQIILTYLALNAALTLVLLPFGPALYGYGNMIAAALTLLVGFGLVFRELPWLHYHAFVTNNPSISRTGQ